MQGDRFFGEIHTLEKLFRSVNQDSGDLSVFNRRLLLNIYDIAVMDSGTDHAVALTFEGEIAADIVEYIVIAVEVLRGVYRLTAGDTTETRTLDGVGSGWKPGGIAVCSSFQPMIHAAETPKTFAIFSILSNGILSVSPVAYLCNADFGMSVRFDSSP